MAGYTYTDWNNAIGALIQVVMTAPGTATPSSDANYNTIYPRAIEFAEQRIYRELDLLACVVTDATGTLTPSSRLFALPTATGTFLVVEQVKIVVSGAPQPPILPVARDYLDAAFPTNTPVGSPSVPTNWCMYDNARILVGPAPDSGYGVEIVGTQRPAPLSSTNTTTILTTMLPDLFLAGTMIFFAGYQRDFGAQSDDPQMAQSWQQQYEKAFASANVEEVRKKYMSQGWNSRMPSPIAAPAQT